MSFEGIKWIERYLVLLKENVKFWKKAEDNDTRKIQSASEAEQARTKEV